MWTIHLEKNCVWMWDHKVIWRSGNHFGSNFLSTSNEIQNNKVRVILLEFNLCFSRSWRHSLKMIMILHYPTLQINKVSVPRSVQVYRFLETIRRTKTTLFSLKMNHLLNLMIENWAIIKKNLSEENENLQYSSSSVIWLADIETSCASSFLVNRFDVLDHIVNVLFFQ